MSKILDELLAANKSYAKKFGTKRDLQAAPKKSLQYLLVWMQGLILQSLQDYLKVMHT